LAPIEIRKAALGIGQRRHPQPIIYSASKCHEPLGSITDAALPAAVLITSTTATRDYQREKDQQREKTHHFEMFHRDSVRHILVIYL
jgi:hypothetical protein